MFWIIGARTLAVGVAGINLPGLSTITRQLTHTEWEGFTFYDFIFPLFIFITGVSLVFSIHKRLEHGDKRSAILRHIMLRTALLFLLGIIYNGFTSGQPFLTGIRYMGVLQRTALCYFFASVLVLYTRPRQQAVSVAGIIIGYWVLMKFVPVPGYGAGIWTEQVNLARYVDNIFLPGRLFFGDWDPEGLLSTIPAIASCLMGVLTAHWLRTTEWRKKALGDKQRAAYLFMAGAALTILGILISPYFPIIKKLWTSSFVLVTGGLSVMLLAAFHWLIDIQGKRNWAFPFVVIGMNSIFIYMAARFIPFDKMAEWIAGGDFLAFLGGAQNVLIALAQLLLEGLVLLWLYKRKRFIRI